jgi:hypothetical protein
MSDTNRAARSLWLAQLAAPSGHVRAEIAMWDVDWRLVTAVDVLGLAELARVAGSMMGTTASELQARRRDMSAATMAALITAQVAGLGDPATATFADGKRQRTHVTLGTVGKATGVPLAYAGGLVGFPSAFGTWPQQADVKQLLLPARPLPIPTVGGLLAQSLVSKQPVSLARLSEATGLVPFLLAGGLRFVGQYLAQRGVEYRWALPLEEENLLRLVAFAAVSGRFTTLGRGEVGVVRMPDLREDPTAVARFAVDGSVQVS